ncbi:glycosyltransferase family 1 protein [Rhizobium wenxiniae]|uniref:glycosyltransferase family 1 protein n=1 Tax=Rhizobium wenxiniae TaxID=1737357 RepID=UPI001C6E51F5|nr:glycosyltransferase family 1 protein [Rhizobium wenxiniae]MBW9091770.1 glycosyltransferase family 1 protein [Rhizobium wenxiniae]
MNVSLLTKPRGHSSREIFLCFSHLRWNFVFQRPQHLLTRATRTYDVYYWEEPVFEDVPAAWLHRSTSDEGVEIVVPHLPQGRQIDAAAIQAQLLEGFLSDLRRPPSVLWYYTPMALEFSRWLSADLIVYDNMDELSAFDGAPPEVIALENEMFSISDIVFTGGQSLYEAKKDRHRNIHPFPSSIDASHFNKARQADGDPPDQAAIPHPRIGFFGVIDERMDIDLLFQAADMRPDWQFVMIGPVVKVDPRILPCRDNIHWLGPKSYKELPAYLAHWDIGLMPFALNDATRFISPTKTPEFLAAGLPVLSTMIRDVVRPYGDLGLVEIIDGAEDLCARTALLLDRPKEHWLSRADEFLAQNSWDQTWAAMQAHMARPNTRNLIEAQEAAYV